jgi:L-ribulose-5-phosphate 4-epimerase
MFYEELRHEVWKANLEIVEAGLVSLTFGNVSGVSRKEGIFAIKPSGVPYASLRPEDIVVVSLDTMEVVDGSLRPSSDTPTHHALYAHFEGIAGVVHTHSRMATSWAQAVRSIPCLGTTHADHFHGDIPVTRRLRNEEVRGAYERATGEVIVETFRENQIDPLEIPAVLVAGHGPFVWGDSVSAAVENAVVLELIAEMAAETVALEPDVAPLDGVLLDKHFLRKHGSKSYYGQDEEAS